MHSNRQAGKPATLGLSAREVKAFSITRAITAAALEDWTVAGHERECAQAARRLAGKAEPALHEFVIPAELLAQRDLIVGTSTMGGYLTSSHEVPMVAGALIESSRVLAAGAMVVPFVGAGAVPREDSAATPYWLADEATAVTESTPGFKESAVAPKTVGVLCEASRQLLKQTGADALITRQLVRRLGPALDAAALGGAGTGGEPTGLTGITGVGGFTGASLALAALLNGQQDVLDAAGVVNINALGYMTTPAVAALLAARQQFSGVDSPLWRGNLAQGSVAGVRAWSTTSAPSASMFFGDWSQLVIAEWGPGIEVLVNPYGAGFKAGIVSYRALYAVDIAVTHPACFSVGTGIT